MTERQALELAYLMLEKIADGKSFSALEYHANLSAIRSAIGIKRAETIKEIASNTVNR